MGKNGADPQAAIEATIVDKLMKIEDHVSTIRTMIEDHAGAAAQRQREVLAAIRAAEETGRYYGDQLSKSYHRLERLYRRLDEQLRTIDEELSITPPPEPPN